MAGRLPTFPLVYLFGVKKENRETMQRRRGGLRKPHLFRVFFSPVWQQFRNSVVEGAWKKESLLQGRLLLF